MVTPLVHSPATLWNASIGNHSGTNPAPLPPDPQSRTRVSPVQCLARSDDRSTEGIHQQKRFPLNSRGTSAVQLIHRLGAHTLVLPEPAREDKATPMELPRISHGYPTGTQRTTSQSPGSYLAGGSHVVRTPVALMRL